MKEISQNKSSASSQHAHHQPFFQRKADDAAAADPGYFFNAIQPKLTVSSAHDPYEQEADNIADQVVYGSESKSPGVGGGAAGNVGTWTIHRKPFIQKSEDDQEIQTKLLPVIQKSGLLEDTPEQDAAEVQTKTDGAQSPNPGRSFESKLSVSKGGGSPLVPSIRARMEPGIGADFSKVKVHTGASAIQMTNRIGARAFAHGNDIYFNEGQYDASSTQGQHLIAHELTHTVQQGASIQTKTNVASRGADRVQRLPDWILEELNDYARYIPGWTLFTVIIGFNPLLGRRVDRNAQNLVMGLLELIPVFGVLLYNKLSELGVLTDAFTWIENQLSALDLSLSRLERTIDAAWEDVSIVRGLSYNIGVLERHFGGLYRDVVTFTGRVGDKVLELIKNALISFLKSFAESVPGYRLLTKILGKDPLTDEPVEATTAEIITDFLMLIGAERELQKMQEEGTLQETADWIDEQLALLNFSFAEIKGLFEQTWQSFSFEDVRDPTGAYNRVVGIWTPFLTRVGTFAYNVAVKVVEFVKHALLSQLRAFALETRGYHLLTVLLGKDPFTQEEVPRSVENIIRGFMSLMEGGEQQFQEMKASGAIASAAGRINAAVEELGFTWEYIVGLFTGLWNSFTIDDIFNPFGAFERIISTFADPLFRLVRFIVKIVRIVIEIVLEIMQFPTHLIGQIINNIQQAWEQIKAQPIEFIKNLLRSVKLGFVQFFDNIATHLLNGVNGWLFKELEDAGITPPQDFSLSSILQLVMQVLGITIDRLWQKLGEKIGPERVERVRSMIDRLEGAWAFIRDVMENGPSAIWRYVSDMLGNLWNMVLDAVKNWAFTRIIQAVTTKLLSMLDPTGIMAVVNSFIAIFRAIQSFIAYLREMLETFARFIEGVLAVAMGNLKPAAEKLEQALGRAMPIVIGFLANQVGLSGLGGRVGEMIVGLQERVDRALDWLIDRAISAGRAVLNSIMGGGEPEEAQDREEDYGPEKAAQVEAGLNTVRIEEDRLAVNGKISREQAEQVATIVRQNHPVFTSFMVVDGTDSWNYEYTASPAQELDTPTGKAEGDEGGELITALQGRFGMERFSKKSAKEQIVNDTIRPGTIDRLFPELVNAGRLFVYQSGENDPHKRFTLDSAKGGTRQIPPGAASRRTLFGYSNPSHDSPTGRSVLAKGIAWDKLENLGINRTNVSATDWNFLNSQAWFISVRPGTSHTYSENHDGTYQRSRAILGHDESSVKGASDHWNKYGMKQTRSSNISWNNNPNSYWGPEERHESASSGSDSPPYLDPHPEQGAHESWWNPSHSEYPQVAGYNFDFTDWQND